MTALKMKISSAFRKRLWGVKIPTQVILKRGRRKVFEDGGGGLTIVPVVDFPNLKRVVNFIYEGQISFGSQEELDEFSDALILLKV